MMMSSGALEPAFILHARNYRDTSLILDLLTRATGRYSMVVKGARSPRSRVRSRLQPFVPLLVASVGRGELKTSTSIDFPANPYLLSGDSLMLGMYINELLYRVLGKFDPLNELYDQYEIVLDELQRIDNNVLAVRRFELQLLGELGYGIDFDYDARSSEPVQSELHYQYVVHEGFHQTTRADADLFPGRELQHLSAGNLEEVDDRRLRNLARLSLAQLLGDKPLKSRSLFRKLAR
jgi:DNA repair protein RecO (recombination protein O)